MIFSIISCFYVFIYWKYLYGPNFNPWSVAPPSFTLRGRPSLKQRCWASWADEQVSGISIHPSGHKPKRNDCYNLFANRLYKWPGSLFLNYINFIESAFFPFTGNYIEKILKQFEEFVLRMQFLFLRFLKKFELQKTNKLVER